MPPKKSYNKHRPSNTTKKKTSSSFQKAKVTKVTVIHHHHHQVKASVPSQKVPCKTSSRSSSTGPSTTPYVAKGQSIPSAVNVSTSHTDRVNIYILELEGGKYYVGKSKKNVDERFQEHLTGSGSAWTKTYPPRRVALAIPDCDPFDEDKWTMKFMLKYGIENVRGGSYTRVTLLQSDVDYLVRQLRGSSDKCFVCGSNEHFANRCPNNHIDAEAIVTQPVVICLRCNREGHVTESCYAKTNVEGGPPGRPVCARCGREGHGAESCYAKTHVEGGPPGRPVCARCGRDGHGAESCYAKTHVNGGQPACARCGREGHDAESCYAKTHVGGSLPRPYAC